MMMMMDINWTWKIKMGINWTLIQNSIARDISRQWGRACQYRNGLKFGITIKTTAGNSPLNNGVEKRHNETLGSMIEKKFCLFYCLTCYEIYWYFWEKRMMFLNMIHKGHILLVCPVCKNCCENVRIANLSEPTVQLSFN